MWVLVEELLYEDYVVSCCVLIGECVFDFSFGQLRLGGMVYLVCGDEEGNLVLFIQSNYYGFGFGVVVFGIGIVLQNCGVEFSFDLDYVNCLELGKQIFYIIIFGFFSKDGVLFGLFGVMGVYMQLQGYVQMVMNLVDFGFNFQVVFDVLCWQWLGGLCVGIEYVVLCVLVVELVQCGYQVEIVYDLISYGCGQIVLCDLVSGVFCGGIELCIDLQIVVW